MTRSGGDDTFDIPDAVVPSERPMIAPPAMLLSADIVAAVRFQESRPGYNYGQVETFVEQVKDSIAFYQARLSAADLELTERSEEVFDLQETISRLKATIEVFRAKGDPVVAADGSYVTESQLDTSGEAAALRQERDALTAELAAAREDADRGWAAEGELREYIESVLAPWLAAQTPGMPAPEQEPAAEREVEQPVAVEVDEPAVSVVAEPVVEPSVAESPVVAAPVVETPVAVAPVAVDPDLQLLASSPEAEALGVSAVLKPLPQAGASSRGHKPSLLATAPEALAAQGAVSPEDQGGDAS